MQYRVGWQEKQGRHDGDSKEEVENLCKGDLGEILHEYATCTHNFYLSLGRKITGDDQ